MPVHIIERFAKAKGDERLMEDTHVISPDYIAVFDGATPKTALSVNAIQTPGQYVAQTLASAMKDLPTDICAHEAIRQLTSHITPHIGEASGIIYSAARREIWSVGDCQAALIAYDGQLTIIQQRKTIDRILSDWRASVIRSYLSRGLCSAEDVRHNDPGRKIIQPFITRQVRYQNIDSDHQLAFGAFDGTTIPSRFINVTPIPPQTKEIILASDGYECLAATSEETEILLKQMLKEDPLCIGRMSGTKGIKAGNDAADDRTYIRFSLE
ncbi:MAG: hypothetical protein KBT20_02975 [Bacteroidales bacterium]|nr:hypothetical protein [Candidatus Liminaster caballi]